MIKIKPNKWIKILEKPETIQEIKEKIMQNPKLAELSNKKTNITLKVCLYMKDEKVYIENTCTEYKPADNETELEYLTITSFDKTNLPLKDYLNDNLDWPEHDINSIIKVLKQRKKYYEEKELKILIIERQINFVNKEN